MTIPDTDNEWYFTVGAFVKVTVIICSKSKKRDKMTEPVTRNTNIIVVLNENKDKDRHLVAELI